MDGKDEKILSILEEDGRASYTEIAEKIDVSEGTVRNRVEKLKQDGVIERFTVDVNDSTQIQSFVSINVSTDREFKEILDDFPVDVEIFELAGDIDILVKVSADSSEEINDKVDEIRGIEGVEETTTYMVLSENK
mgnify:CR=1 FL=1